MIWKKFVTIQHNNLGRNIFYYILSQILLQCITTFVIIQNIFCYDLIRNKFVQMYMLQIVTSLLQFVKTVDTIQNIFCRNLIRNNFFQMHLLHIVTTFVMIHVQAFSQISPLLLQNIHIQEGKTSTFSLVKHYIQAFSQIYGLKSNIKPRHPNNKLKNHFVHFFFNFLSDLVSYYLHY